MTQFEIWWAELREPAGRRPVLLLSRPDAYSYLNKFIAAEITSTIRGIASEVVVGEAEGCPRFAPSTATICAWCYVSR